MFHDSHVQPEPMLVLSGLTYLVPSSLALSSGKLFASPYIFLTFTTIGFHSTRTELFFLFDCLAMSIFFLQNTSLCFRATKLTQTLWATSVIYCFICYFVGKYYTILSFDPNWNTQMTYQAIMHISTSYSAYRLIKDSRL